MSGFIALAVIACAVFFVLGTLALIGFILKVLFWAVFFPIRLAFKLIFGLLGLGLAVVLIPLVMIVAFIAIVGALLAALFAVVAPLLPVLLLGLVGWGIYRASTRSSVGGFAGS
jgi:hypothetical protein